jgi:phytoene desaturase
MVMDISSGSSKERSAVIIGAGPGGLAAAILLAAAGIRVRILERLPIVGGRTSTIESDGFRFDLGPTFFLYPRVLEEIMRAAGTSLADEVELVRLDPQYRLIFGAGGQKPRLHSHVAVMERRSPPSRLTTPGGFERFMRDNLRKLEAECSLAWENAFGGWRDVSPQTGHD